MVSATTGQPPRSPAATPGWDWDRPGSRGAGRRLQVWKGVKSGGARAGLGSPGGAALGSVGGGRAELGSGQLDPAGWGGLGVAESVRLRFWSGESESPWTQLGLEIPVIQAGSVAWVGDNSETAGSSWT